MGFKHIKLILIIGMLWSIFASLLKFVFTQQSALMIFAFSLIGHCVFAFGLFMLDRRVKSILSSYYLVLLCIFVMLFYLERQESANIIVTLCLVLCFFFILFCYLQLFTRISGQALFIRSFYVLLASVLIGLFCLGAFETARNPKVAVFILSAMVSPSFLMYLFAIFSLQNVSLEKFNKVIL